MDTRHDAHFLEHGRPQHGQFAHRGAGHQKVNESQTRAERHCEISVRDWCSPLVDARMLATWHVDGLHNRHVPQASIHGSDHSLFGGWSRSHRARAFFGNGVDSRGPGPLFQALPSSGSAETMSPPRRLRETVSEPGLMRGPDGELYPEWDPRNGPLPPDYPRVRRSRAQTPVGRAPTTETAPEPPNVPASARREEAAVSRAVTGLLKGVAGEVKRAAAGARQDVGNKQRPARPAKRRPRWLTMPRASSCLYVCAAVVLLAVAREPSLLRELLRTATAFADVAEGAGSLASAASFAAANATVAVTTTAAGLASSSLSLAKEAWEGVDLLNVTANRSHGRVVASTLEEIETWISSSNNFQRIPVTAATLLAPARGLSATMVFIEWGDSSADVSGGSWTTWNVRARSLRSGQLALAFELHVISFHARWSNPLWEFLDICPNDSSEQVLKVLSGIVTAMPPVPAGETSLDDMALGMGSADNTMQLDKPLSVVDLYGNAALVRTVLLRSALLALASGFGYAAFFAYGARLAPAPPTEPEPVPIHTPPSTPRPCTENLLDGFAVVNQSASHALDGTGSSGSPHSPQTPSSRRRFEQAAQCDAAGR